MYKRQEVVEKQRRQVCLKFSSPPVPDQQPRQVLQLLVSACLLPLENDVAWSELSSREDKLKDREGGAERRRNNKLESVKFIRRAPKIVQLDTTPPTASDGSKENNQNDDKMEILIDGPFGSPSSDIYRAEHAVLVATGIGVTPYASILQSVMFRHRNKLRPSWASPIFNLRKVDFFWINRDQACFEWFVNLLSQLEIEQAEEGGTMDRCLV